MSEPIVDAHHHIWRQSDLLWLQGPSVPRIFGPYDAIKRDYSIAEFKAEAEAQGVVRSVYVQANWPKGREVDEVAWVTGEAAHSGWPHAIVGYADFRSDTFAETLAAQSRFPLMRGLRQQIHWHEKPLYRFASEPGIADDPTFQANVARLADHDWLFELQLFTSQFDSGVRLAKAVPGVTLVLQHAGMLQDLSREGRRAWREGMKRLAERPNIYSKLSGLGTFLQRNDASHISDVFGQTLEIFGADRCLWGSNFPIEKLWTDYASLVGAVRAAVAGLSAADRTNVLSANALKLYRLPL